MILEKLSSKLKKIIFVLLLLELVISQSKLQTLLPEIEEIIQKGR
jgi:hypothetical protein